MVEVKTDADLRDTVARALQHLNAGRLDAAEELIDAALEASDNHPKVQHFKGQILVRRGDLEGGYERMDAAIHDAPDDPVLLSDHGVHLTQRGDLDGARECFEHAVDLAPKFATAHGNLGGVLALQKNYPAAITHLRTAIELDPRLLDAHKNLGNTYIQCNQFDPAIDILYRGLAIDPQHVGLHLLLSSALFRRDRFEAAEHHARRALEIEPEAQEAYVHLGNALASSGKLDEAVSTYRVIAGKSPVGIAALSKLTQSSKISEGSPDLAMIREIADDLRGVGEESQATALFAAGKAHDDIGDYDRAFGYYRSGNRIIAALYPFDAEQSRQRTDRVIQFCSPALMERCGKGGVTEAAPIFICGMPRSGTTLLEQMFSRHPRVQAGGEMAATFTAFRRNARIVAAMEERIAETDVGPDDFSRFGEDYLAYARSEGLRSEHFTDKMPANCRYIGILALAFPRARFLVMRRHPLDCLLSNYFQHFGRNQPFSSDFGNLASVYREFDISARTWADRLPNRVLEVSYEEITRNTETEIRRACDFTGLGWTDEMLNYRGSSRQVATASIAQVRQPIYSHAVARWRRYAGHLRPLASSIRDLLDQEDRAYLGI